MLRGYRIIHLQNGKRRGNVQARFWILPTAVRIFDGMRHGKDQHLYADGSLHLQHFDRYSLTWRNVSDTTVRSVLLRSLSVRNPS